MWKGSSCQREVLCLGRLEQAIVKLAAPESVEQIQYNGPEIVVLLVAACPYSNSCWQLAI